MFFVEIGYVCIGIVLGYFLVTIAGLDEKFLEGEWKARSVEELHQEGLG